MKFEGNYFGFDVFSEEKLEGHALMTPHDSTPWFFCRSIIEKFIWEHRN
jgi:hypothetical protein